MYYLYVLVKFVFMILSYSFFYGSIWCLKILRNYYIYIFLYVMICGFNLIDFIYKYVRCNVYFGRRFKKINKICKVMYVYFLLFIF